MENIEKINAEMKIANKECPNCNMPFRAKDVIGIGVHFVDCRANERLVREPMTFYVVRCSLCGLRGTCDSLMNKHDMVETTSQVWDETIHLAWLAYGADGRPLAEFIRDREEESLDRFFTFTRVFNQSKESTDQEQE
jgi:hypothetical protein